jgi:outer membrane protein, heavy metal efflux system
LGGLYQINVRSSANAETMMSREEKRSLLWCLLFAALGTAGCAMPRGVFAKDHPEALLESTAASQTAIDRGSLAIEPVGAPEITAVAYSEAVSGQLIETSVETTSQDGNDATTMVSSGGMTLVEFESNALANNPTLKQLAATTQKAAGFRQQVSLRANPVMGYQGTQLADEGTDQHTAFISQEIVTAGKLDLNRRVLNEAVRAQLFELDAQQQRVLTDVRIAFYTALAAQQRVILTGDFQSVGTKGFELAELRKKAQEASQIEVLQAKIQMNEVDLAKQQAEVQYAAAWRELAALVGSPNMTPVRLVGQLEQTREPIDWTSKQATLMSGSPEYMAAQTRVQQARINLQRQGVQAIPNLNVQMAAGVDNGTNSGLINVQVGAPIPVFNKNQGNITAARAEYCRAVMEVNRIENSIQQRLAVVSNQYESAMAAVNKYENEILPSARETLSLAEEAYKAGEFSFLEVLIVRRTYFASNLQYLDAQVSLAQAAAQVDGFVLTGGLNATVDMSGDDSLRGQTFSQQ